MSNADSYTKFLKGLRLRYFQPEEITSYADAVRNGEKNSLPPEEMWDALVPTINTLDALRHYIKKPITLTSIYRSPSYNRKGVNGAKHSYHMKNCAIDFQVKGMSPQGVFLQLRNLRQAGAFLGGISAYSTFCHVDTRGSNATW